MHRDFINCFRVSCLSHVSFLDGLAQEFIPSRYSLYEQAKEQFIKRLALVSSEHPLTYSYEDFKEKIENDLIALDELTRTLQQTTPITRTHRPHRTRRMVLMGQH